MHTILTTKKATSITKQLKDQGKSIVLTGGCFDILHPGHLQLLEKAKKQGDILVVLLESDEKIKKIKGATKPIFPQLERAHMLSNIRFVDYVILLPFFDKNEQYDHLITSISPNIIATTENDPHIADKKRQAERIKAKVIEVTPYFPQYATSKIIEVIQKEI